MQLALLLLAGCGAVDIPLVTVDAGQDMTIGPMGSPCANSSECVGGQFCDKLSCGAALGHCAPQPPFCQGGLMPSCGCDGVMYWNDCLRRRAGIESRDMDLCFNNPRTCDTTNPCPDGAYCARLVEPNRCGPGAVGTCFVLPDTCEGSTPDHFYECGTGMTQCLDGCGAIRSGKIVERHRGPCP